MRAGLAVMLGGVALIAMAAQGATTHVVCPEQSREAGCGFKGGAGIQAAVDAAASGDAIFIKAGRYSAAAYRDVPYKIHTIRGFIVVAGKSLTIAGEQGTVLDGASGPPTTALIVHRADATLSNLTITGFRFDVEEDETYEGHGIFVIDGKARIDGVTIAKFQKMGLTGRGVSQLDATNVRILDGHVAIWLHESATLRLRNSIVRGNDSSGVAAYDSSVAHVANSVFDGNLDDALYSEHDAAIYATNCLLLRNKPYAARAMNDSRIWLGYSVLFDNEKNIARTKGHAYVKRGPNLIEADPKVDTEYRPSAASLLVGKGDPDLGVPVGSPSQIGLQ